MVNEFVLFGLIVVLFLFIYLIGQHVYYLYRLNQWLLDASFELPKGMGAWEKAFARLNRQTRQQYLAQKKLENVLERFIQAGEAMPDGVMVLNETDQIEWMNPMACAHFSLNREQDIGAKVCDLVRQPSFSQYLKAQQFSQALTLKVVRDGADVRLSIQLVPFDSTRKLLLSQDHTQLERVQLSHQDFVANVSHELRTPLTVVGGFLETLADSPDLDKATLAHALSLMQSQTQRMQHLVSDLLTLSRLESKPSFAAQHVIHMPDVLRDLELEANSLSQQRHHIVVQCLDECPILGEQNEFYSALSNLVSNAVRYTPEGGRIEIVWRVEQRGKTWRGIFSVRDTGIGIEKQDIARLTERFFRVDRGRSRDTGGTGLGLAIVRQVLARHDARLEIESLPNVGSEFRVVISSARLVLDSKLSS